MVVAKGLHSASAKTKHSFFGDLVSPDHKILNGYSLKADFIQTW